MLYVRQTNYQNVSQGVEREVEEVIRAYGKRMWVHLHKPTYTTYFDVGQQRGSGYTRGPV
jgi:hypothetical protein